MYRKVRVTITAVNRLSTKPMANVTAKPATMLAPGVCPNIKRMPQMIIVDRLESRMDVQARSKPAFNAASRGKPARSSSLIRSKIRMLPSTAVPMEIKKPVIAGRVKVTGSSLKTAMFRKMKTTSARSAATPGSR